MKSISMADFYKKQQTEELSIIDVREPYEFNSGHVPGAVNYPLGNLIDTFGKIDETKEQYVICQGGDRSELATAFLASQGIDAIDVLGGTADYPGELE